MVGVAIAFVLLFGMSVAIGVVVERKLLKQIRRLAAEANHLRFVNGALTHAISEDADEFRQVAGRLADTSAALKLSSEEVLSLQNQLAATQVMYAKLRVALSAIEELSRRSARPDAPKSPCGCKEAGGFATIEQGDANA